jgi:hypothetical protein
MEHLKIKVAIIKRCASYVQRLAPHCSGFYKARETKMLADSLLGIDVPQGVVEYVCANDFGTIARGISVEYRYARELDSLKPDWEDPIE